MAAALLDLLLTAEETAAVRAASVDALAAGWARLVATRASTSECTPTCHAPRPCPKLHTPASQWPQAGDATAGFKYLLSLHAFAVTDVQLCVPPKDPSTFVRSLAPYLKLAPGAGCVFSLHWRSWQQPAAPRHGVLLPSTPLPSNNLRPQRHHRAARARGAAPSPCCAC